MPRKYELVRQTRETSIRVMVMVDGKGKYSVKTQVGFLNHLLETFARHGFFDIEVEATGDIVTGAHHLAEDVGIVLGGAFGGALKKGGGIKRFGWALIPMDESLAQVAVDLSGRPLLVCDKSIPVVEIGGMTTYDFYEFLKGFALSLPMTLHVSCKGEDPHHMMEAVMKALARSLDEATSIDRRLEGQPPSTKGVLL